MRLPSCVSTLDGAVEGIAAMGGRRPVYLDMQATEILHDRIGYRTAGLVSQVVPGVGAQPPQDLDGVTHVLSAAEERVPAARDGARWDRWPNELLYGAFAQAQLEIARIDLQPTWWG